MTTADNTPILTPTPTPTTKRTGGCHCGAVRFEVEIDESQGGARCNCSICTKTAATSAIVKPAAFVLLAGGANLGAYEWGGKTARRFFCRSCGIHCFGRGHLAELGGDYVSVNLNAIDEFDVATVKVIYWDGRHDNWEAGPRPTPWPVAAPSNDVRPNVWTHMYF